VREAHVKEDAAILKDCGGGVIGEVLLHPLGELGGIGLGRRRLAGGHDARYQP
jgi:hypothetical protein